MHQADEGVQIIEEALELGWLSDPQPPQRCQRVEQEMGLNLRLERLQAQRSRLTGRRPLCMNSVASSTVRRQRTLAGEIKPGDGPANQAPTSDLGKPGNPGLRRIGR